MKRFFLRQIQDWNESDVLSVLGPTGSGKTSLVLGEIRRRYPQNLKHPCLVSLDAVSVYRGLDIGSAKPLGNSRLDFDWAGIDMADPDVKVTAADFVKEVLPRIELALKANRPVILVGGSHFYERALVEGMSPGEASDPEFQKSLEATSAGDLHARLLEKDPRWSKLHINDRYRICRYLDLVERQGLSFDELNAGVLKNQRAWDSTATLVLGVDANPDDIRQQMRSRIREMLVQGWIPETQKLLNLYGATAPAIGAVGYREILEYLASPKESRSPMDLEEKILVAHMQLAKKQRTWLRGLMRT